MLSRAIPAAPRIVTSDAFTRFGISSCQTRAFQVGYGWRAKYCGAPPVPARRPAFPGNGPLADL
jgi:hypothetical protein